MLTPTGPLIATVSRGQSLLWELRCELLNYGFMRTIITINLPGYMTRFAFNWPEEEAEEHGFLFQNFCSVLTSG